jgi:hypothetical protein
MCIKTMCVCVCVRARVCMCMRACVRVCVGFVRAFVGAILITITLIAHQHALMVFIHSVHICVWGNGGCEDTMKLALLLPLLLLPTA